MHAMRVTTSLIAVPLVVVALISTRAGGRPADESRKPGQDAAVDPEEEMNLILAEWETRSMKVRSLDISFTRIDRSSAWGDQHYRGRAMLRGRDLGCIEYAKFQVGIDGKPPGRVESEPSERIVFTGKEMLRYSWPDKSIHVFSLNHGFTRTILDQLGGGLPFVSNVKADDLRHRYKITLVKQDAKEYLIRFVPNQDASKKAFKEALLWLNKETYLPDRLWLYPVGHKEWQEFHFIGGNNSMSLNTPLDEKFFAFSKIPGWKVFDNPIPSSWFK